MKHDSVTDSIIGAGLALLLMTLINPFDIFMPSQLTTMLLGGIAILLLLFTSFIWKETVQDERDNFHRLLAARISFLAGAAVLLIGIIVQTLSHSLDPWLAAALGAMVLIKLAVRVYSRTKL